MSGEESYLPVEMLADIYELADAAFDVAEAEAWLRKAYAEKRLTEFLTGYVAAVEYDPETWRGVK